MADMADVRAVAAKGERGAWAFHHSIDSCRLQGGRLGPDIPPQRMERQYPPPLQPVTEQRAVLERP